MLFFLFIFNIFHISPGKQGSLINGFYLFNIFPIVEGGQYDLIRLTLLVVNTWLTVASLFTGLTCLGRLELWPLGLDGLVSRHTSLGWLIISKSWNTHDHFYSQSFGGISDEIFIKTNEKTFTVHLSLQILTRIKICYLVFNINNKSYNMTYNIQKIWKAAQTL